MAKRGRKEKDNWKKKRRQEYLEKKVISLLYFLRGTSNGNLSIFKDFKRYIEDNPIYRDMVLIEIEGCQAEYDAGNRKG